MNNKLIRGAAVVIICLFSAMVVKDELVNPESLKYYIGIGFVTTVILNILITKRNRAIILSRRRLMIDMRKRVSLVDQGVKTWEEVIKKDEELILQFFGTVIASTKTLLLITSGVIIALVFGWYLIALVLVLGHLFLDIEFFFAGRTIYNRLKPDSTRSFPNTEIQLFDHVNYQVEIDLNKVKSFTLLPPGTMFWTDQQVIRWLQYCGFSRIHNNLWRTKGSALKFLDSNEIINIVPQ